MLLLLSFLCLLFNILRQSLSCYCAIKMSCSIISSNSILILSSCSCSVCSGGAGVAGDFSRTLSTKR